MKNLFLILFAAVILSACKKEKKAIDGGCISQIATSRLSASDTITVAGLMKNNNLSTNNLAFYFYEAYYTNNQQVYAQIATATQTKNGLPIFFYDITFGFNNGILNGSAADVAGRPDNVTLDDKPTVNLQTVRNSFLYQDQGFDGNAIAASLKDSCLVAQFGYYDLNLDFPNKGAAFVKAWYVHPKNSQWPQGYFRDDTGAAILFKPLTNPNIP